MFRAADIQIDIHPVLFFCLVDKVFRVFRIDETQVIPATACPLRHRIGFASERSVLVNAVQPVGNVGERRLPCRGRLISLDIGQCERQVRFGAKRAVFIMLDRNRLAPVTLSTEDPVTKLVVDRFFAFAFLFKPVGHHAKCVFECQAVETDLIIR